MPPRFGKQIAHHVPVLTTKGWKRHGELMVGDEVFGGDGCPREVSATSEEREQDMFIEFTNGERIECHENHEWVFYDRAAGGIKIFETKDLLKRTLEIGERGKRGHRYVLQVPFRDELKPMVEQDLKIHPYVLGVWLGDGSTTKNCITYCEKDRRVIERCSELDYAPTTHNTHRITGVHTDYIKRLYGELKQEGILGNKHIPMKYILGTQEQRRFLMAGLIDTDGYVNKCGRVTFSTCLSQLRDDVMLLARTFGAEPYYVTTAPCLSSSGIQGGKPTFNVCFYLDFKLPVALKRKQTGKKYVKRRRAVKRVGFCPPTKGRCIQVENGIYLVGEKLIPTHNSELASIKFPAWFLGKFPEKNIISCNHTFDLAERFGKFTRAIVDSKIHRGIFPKCQLQKGSKSATKWKVSERGGYLATGVGGSITGSGADILIIDDPIKNYQEAASETFRENVWNWYTSTAFTRLESEGKIIIINTRWHDDDLTGRLLQLEGQKGYYYDPKTAKWIKNNDKDAPLPVGAKKGKWTVLSFPAIAVEQEEYRRIGEALWPEKFSLEALLDKKATLPVRDWSAMYQQDPSTEEGREFQTEWFKYWKILPDNLRYVTTVDLAISQKDYADYSVVMTTAMSTDDRIFVVEYKNWRANPSEVIEEIYRHQTKYRSLVGVEATGYQQSLMHYLQLDGQKRGHYLHVEPIQSRSSKEQKIRGLIPFYNNGLIFHSPDGTDELEDQLKRFPYGKHDDICDAFSMALPFLRRPSTTNFAPPDQLGLTWGKDGRPML